MPMIQDGGGGPLDVIDMEGHAVWGAAIAARVEAGRPRRDDLNDASKGL